MIRFETQHKYYQIELTVDLFGDTVVLAHYGSKRTWHNQTKTYYAASHIEAKRIIKRLYSTRLRHGYDIIYNDLMLMV